MSAFLTQDDAGMLADVGNQVQHTFQLFLSHETRCAVSPLVGINQITLPVIRAGFTVAHPHNHEHQYAQGRYTAAHTVQTVGPAEHSGDTDKEVTVWKFRGSTENSARRLPHVVVVEELYSRFRRAERPERPAK